MTMRFNPNHIVTVLPLLGVLLRAMRNKQNYSVGEQAIILVALGILSWLSVDTFKDYNPFWVGVCGLFVGINFTTLVSLSIRFTPKVVKGILESRGILKTDKSDNDE